MEENNTYQPKQARESLHNRYFLFPFFASFVFFVVTLMLAGGVVWHFRESIFKYLAEEYFEANDNKVVLDTFKEEYAIVEAVKRANPAVVSIVLTKNIPTYSVVHHLRPLSDFFPELSDLFFNVPEYRQSGTEKREVGSGSGFFISIDGLIVTNKHVVEGSEVEYTVFTNDGEMYKAVLVDIDPLIDIAILKIEEPTKIFGHAYLPLGDSDALEIGQGVISIGNALGEFRNTVSAGIVSGLSRSIVAGDIFGNREVLDEVIQTDAAINPGNSGGPLLDTSGKVIGVNVAIAQGSQNVGFALPINAVKGAIDSVRESGRIIRPYLGINYIAINPEIKKRGNLPVQYGVLVRRRDNKNEYAVIPNGPADKAGVLENDIILEIDGEKIDKDTTFSSLIRKRKVGESVTLRILRGDKEIDTRIVFEEA